MVKKKWWFATFLLLAAALATTVIFLQRDFLDDFRSAVSGDVDYLMLCEVGTEKCQTVDRSSDVAFEALVKGLSDVRPKLPPSKPHITKEHVLRIGRGLPAARSYRACYRVIQYSGTEELFINDVAMNIDCTRVERYRPGFAAVPSWKILASFKG